MRTSLLLLLALVCGPAWASDLPAAWKVRSTYVDPVGRVDKAPLVWVFTREGERTWAVRDEGEAVGTAVILRLDEWDRLLRAEVSLRVRGQDRTMTFDFDPDKPALVPDSLAPVDFLNILRGDVSPWPRTYSVKRIIAKTAFAAGLTVYREPVGVKDAVESGFLSPEQGERMNTERFFWYRVTATSGGVEEEVLAQLWSEDRPIWIFERTPFRSSMLIFEDEP